MTWKIIQSGFSELKWARTFIFYKNGQELDKFLSYDFLPNFKIEEDKMENFEMN